MDPSFFAIGQATPGGSSTVEKEKPDGFAAAIGRRFSDNAPMLTARLSPLALERQQENPFDTHQQVVESPSKTPDRPGVSVTAPMSNMTLGSPPPSSQGHRRHVAHAPHSRNTASSSKPVGLLKASELPSVVGQPGVLLLDLRPNSAFSESRLHGALSITAPSMLLKRPAFGVDKVAQSLPTEKQRTLFNGWSTATHILAYDTDTTRLEQNPHLTALLTKFHASGFSGRLSMLGGGFAAVPPQFIERSSLGEKTEKGSKTTHLRSSNLPQAAFQQSSTTHAMRRPGGQPSSDSESQGTGAAAPSSTRIAPANPFYDNIRQNIELSQGASAGIPLRLTRDVRKRLNALPFQWLRQVARSAEREETADALSMQFYRIEIGEQRRLQGIMNHHSSQGDSDSLSDFPYSITSGFEMGQKNRYRNIWPFEHARVKLEKCNSEDGSDYINASHVQPLGTDRKYIATQGPLPATYKDFWRLVWEQGVRVVIMLTKQVEGAHVKCGQYWDDGRYGNLELSCHSSDGQEESTTVTGFDFGNADQKVLTQEIIRREFDLVDMASPDTPTRRITQFQYLDWSDMDVPAEPDGLLRLIKEVDEVTGHGLERARSPVLLHCSAGVGRTGGYIAVDALLDGIRRELASIGSARAESEHPNDEAMDVDDNDNIERASSASSVQSLASPPPASVSGRSSGQYSGQDLAQSPAHSAADPANLLQQALRRGGVNHDVKQPVPNPAKRRRSHKSMSLRPELTSSAVPDEHIHAQSGPTPSSAAPLNAISSVLRRRVQIGESSLTPWMSSYEPSASSTLPSLTSGIFDNTESNVGTQESSLMPSPFPPLAPIGAKSSAKINLPSSDPSQDHSTFDYTAPRVLHVKDAPVIRLSTLHNPIQVVLEDMREQRMSLVQTLRQYVFIHGAVLQGALDIADFAASSFAPSTSGTAGERNVSTGSAFAPKGRVALMKRPSVKRKDRSNDSEAPVPTLASVDMPALALPPPSRR